MNQDIREQVKLKYGSVARSGLSSRDRAVSAVAEAFGYSAEELASIPAEANMGLSCGNPLATASLQPGEVVIDLGSGGGLDVLLAAGRVGPTGRAIGIDMTPEMIELARNNAAKSDSGDIAEFHLAAIDNIPLPDATADCIVSNCVINLAADKPAVFREIFRLLKPGGRLAVSDIALKGPLPDDLANNITAYIGCIAGAISVDDYRSGLLRAGFDAVEIIDSGADLNAYALIEGQSTCCSPAPGASSVLPIANAACCTPDPGQDSDALHQQLAGLLRRYDINQYAASVKVYALKG